MSTFGAESVLVGDVGDGVGHAVFTDEAVRSMDAEGGILRAPGLNLGGLVALRSVAKFIVVFVAVQTDVIVEGFLQYDDFWGVPLGSGEGDGHEGSESNDL